MAHLTLKKHLLSTFCVITFYCFTALSAKAQHESIEHVAVVLMAKEKSNGVYTDFVQIPATNLPPYQNFDTPENERPQQVAALNKHKIANQNFGNSNERLAVLNTESTEAAVLQTDLEPVYEELQSDDFLKESNNIDTIKNTVKQGTFSHVWLGSILMISGVVLGFLFGRTAFLVSGIGFIFILIGIFVF